MQSISALKTCATDFIGYVRWFRSGTVISGMVLLLTHGLTGCAGQHTRNVAAAPTVPPAERGWIGLPHLPTELRFGGYGKLDVIYDIGAAGGYYNYVPGIPLEGTAAAERQGQTRMHARESRIVMETRTPGALGTTTASTVLEADFLTEDGSETQTNSTRLRLRRYYGVLGRLLAGQHWSNFMDLDAIPESVDDAGPSGQIFIRQPQLRYSHPLGADSLCAVSVENGSNDIVTTEEPDPPAPLQRLPDFIGRCTTAWDWGHISSSALLREFRIDDGAARSDSSFGYGLGLAGSLRLRKDRILFQLNGGHGIGRYIIDLAGYGARLGSDQELQPLLVAGGFLAYEHWWTDAIRSTVLVSRTRLFSCTSGAVSCGGPSGLNRMTESLHANVYWDVTSTVEIGLEYSRGRRETLGGASGHTDRLQLGITFYLREAR